MNLYVVQKFSLFQISFVPGVGIEKVYNLFIIEKVKLINTCYQKDWILRVDVISISKSIRKFLESVSH